MPSKEKVIDLIRAHISLTSSEEKLIEDGFKPRILKKGAFFLEIGETNNVIGYLESGLCRSFYYDQEGKEITSGFIQQHHFCTELHSYQTGNKSQRSIEALIDCKILVIERETLTQLKERIKDWSYFEQHYIANLLLQKVNFQRRISNSSASEAYKHFTETYSQAACFAPRYQIASFLGMSPYTLSRINNR